MGGHLVLAKRFREAEPLLLGAERDLTAAIGTDAPTVGETRQRLVDLYTAWGRQADAEKWRRRLPPTP